MSDVMHGPSVFVGDRTKRKTYLIAFIDDATRVIPYAAFALAENTATFLPVLKQAPVAPWTAAAPVCRQRRQLPLPAPGAGMRQARHRADPCAPVPPQGKGKIERWFKTVRAQLLTRLTPKTRPASRR